jgi:hypothetical protein
MFLDAAQNARGHRTEFARVWVGRREARRCILEIPEGFNTPSLSDVQEDDSIDQILYGTSEVDNVSVHVVPGRSTARASRHSLISFRNAWSTVSGRPVPRNQSIEFEPRWPHPPGGGSYRQSSIAHSSKSVTTPNGNRAIASNLVSGVLSRLDVDTRSLRLQEPLPGAIMKKRAIRSLTLPIDDERVLVSDLTSGFRNSLREGPRRPLFRPRMTV